MGAIGLTIQYIVVDLLGGILRWPLWWYTKGLFLTLKWAGKSVQDYIDSIALNVWMKNLFVPMYGLRDWQGRLISFFVRLVQIFSRSLFLIVYSFLLLVLLGLYLTAPIFAVIQVFYHLGGSLL